MERFSIYFDPISNEKWGINSDFYDIYISIGDFAFPGKGWTDLAMYCIDNWAQGFTKLLSGEEKSVVGGFYDGSYHYNLSKVDNTSWRIELVDEDENNKILKEADININQAVLSMLEAIHLVIKIKKEKEPTKTEYWEKMTQALSNLIK